MRRSKKRKPRDLDTPRDGAAEKAWLQYATRFNELCGEVGLSTIRPAGSPTLLNELASVGHISDRQALEMKVSFFAAWIDSMTPLAEFGFYTARMQRSRATGRRTAFNKIVEVSLLANRAATNQDLWTIAIGAARTTKLIVNEYPEPQRLEWEDPDSDESGELGFAAFQVLLATLRSRHRILKRIRKK